MNCLDSHRLRPKALNASALPCLLVFILLFLLLLPALLGAPKSFAARATWPSRTNNAPEAPAVSCCGVYRQANLVSDLPGVALIEDRLLTVPWGVALNSSGPFWVVNNKNDRDNACDRNCDCRGDEPLRSKVTIHCLIHRAISDLCSQS